MSPERQAKRDAKIARTLIRLKHSLAADEEVDEFLDAQRAALTEGRILRLEVDLSDLQS